MRHYEVPAERTSFSPPLFSSFPFFSCLFPCFRFFFLLLPPLFPFSFLFSFSHSSHPRALRFGALTRNLHIRYVDVYPNNLDIELVLANTYLCIPESQRVPPPNGAGAGGKTPGSAGCDDTGRAVIVHADVTLTQVWRGMPQVRGSVQSSSWKAADPWNEPLHAPRVLTLRHVVRSWQRVFPA